MKSKRHEAEQLVSLVIDPPVKLSLTLTLKGDTARLWRVYEAAHAALQPSHGQLAVSLIAQGLEAWKRSLEKPSSL